MQFGNCSFFCFHYFTAEEDLRALRFRAEANHSRHFFNLFQFYEVSSANNLRRWRVSLQLCQLIRQEKKRMHAQKRTSSEESLVILCRRSKLRAERATPSGTTKSAEWITWVYCCWCEETQRGNDETGWPGLGRSFADWRCDAVWGNSKLLIMISLMWGVLKTVFCGCCCNMMGFVVHFAFPSSPIPVLNCLLTIGMRPMVSIAFGMSRMCVGLNKKMCP